MVSPNVEDPAEMLLMIRLLTDIGYRELAKDAGRQRLSVARRLSRDGIDSRVLRLLWDYARASDTHGSPERLFAWWVDRPSRTLQKIVEMRSKNVWLLRANERIETEAKESQQVAPIIEFKRKNA